jgi:hypothetical protein
MAEWNVRLQALQGAKFASNLGAIDPGVGRFALVKCQVSTRRDAKKAVTV